MSTIVGRHSVVTVRGRTEIILDVKNAPKNVSFSWNVSSENESLRN